MRSIILLLLVFVSPASFAAFPYTNVLTGPEVFYPTSVAACQQMIPAAQSFFNSSRTDGKTITFSMGYVSGSNICQYNYVRSDGPSGNSAANISATVTASVSIGQECVSDSSDSLTWPIGRQEVAIGDPSFTAFNFPLPPTYCFNGCLANKDTAGTGQDFFGLPDSNPKYEVIYANIAYTLDGSTCASGSNEPIPALPDPPPPNPCEADPQAQGCGGDTGGGDTGGGDTGGGDTGGGDTGGGDTGGGDTGGGDTGGGDTGGGDTGGGGTGGGDTGGGGTGGGDTGGGTGGGDTGTDEGSASGTDCGVALSCTGDAVGCAIARITKDASCRDKESTDFPAQKDALNQFLGDPLFQPEEEEEINLADFFDSTTRFLPSSCPPDETAHLITNGGRVVEFSYAPLCAFAIDLSYLIVAAAGIFFIYFVSRADGS